MLVTVVGTLLASGLQPGAGLRPTLGTFPGPSRAGTPLDPRSTVGSAFGGNRNPFPSFDTGGQPISGRQAFSTEAGISLYLPAEYARSPRFLKRTDWDPNPPRRAWSGRGQSVLESITIHHSVGPSDQKVAHIRDYHKGKSFARGDIAYHFLIDDNGDIYEGVPLNVEGRHSPPNRGRIGICLLGYFHRDEIQTPHYAKMRASLGYLLEALYAAFPRTKGRVRPHGVEKKKSVNQDKDCPGKYVERWRAGLWESGYSRTRPLAYSPGQKTLAHRHPGHAHGPTTLDPEILELLEQDPGEDEHVPEGWTPPPALP